MSELEKIGISAKEESLIDQIRQRLGHLFTDEFHTDFDILRWLQGHDYNVDVVAEKLKTHLRFRRAFDYKKYKWHPLMKDHFPFGFLNSTGKDDCFVFLDCTGRTDGDGIMRSMPPSAVILTSICRLESIALPAIRKREESTGRQSGMYLIMDLEGMSSNGVNVILNSYRPFGLFMQLHYVEIFQKILLINAASYLYYIWRIFKPFMPERTQRKVVILSSDWRKELLQYVDADALPVHWGGTMVDENGDPMCRSRVVVPSKIPASIHWRAGPDDPPRGTLSQLTVSAGKHEFVSIFGKPGCVLAWYYFTDVEYSFGVYRADADEEFDIETMEMVYPHVFVLAASPHVPEKGAIECTKKGFYRIRFGNEHSWLSRLKVLYKIEMMNDSDKNEID